MVLRIVVFYVLAMFLTFLIGGLQQEAGLLPELTFLPQLGPGIAGLITMLAFYRRDRLRIVFFSPGMLPQRYLWAILLPLVFGLLTFLFARLFLEPAEGMEISPLVVAWMFAGAVGEEIGWRGYLHKRVAPHMNGLLSSLLVGALWTPFHIQFWPGGPVYLAFAGLALISLSIMMYALLAEHEFNVLGATVFHLTINLTAALSVGWLSGLNLVFMIAYSVIAALMAAGVVLVRRDLFLRPLARPEAASQA